jgi:transposase InsO family protein
MNVHSLARTTPLSRALIVQRVLNEKRSVTSTAQSFGISARTVYKWLARHQEHGINGLKDLSSRPHRSPMQLDTPRVELVVQLRRCRQTSPQIARGLKMPCSTVARVLQRAGLHRLKYLQPPEPPRRYERRRPGDLLHMDVKKLGRIVGRVGHRIHGDRRARVKGAGWEYVHVCIDDRSRLAYVEVLPNEQQLTTTGYLERAVAYYRRLDIRVRAVMTDNGSAYVSRMFRTACQMLRLRHLRTRPYRPRTNGKAERFIQTLLREWAYARPYRFSWLRNRALRSWLRYYNRRRPHGALNGLAPISRLPLGCEQRA